MIGRFHFHRHPRSRAGLSLVEVILAIAILGLSLVLIGELVRLGGRSSRTARELATAQMLCESKMAEIASGAATATTTTTPTLFDDFPDWTYTIESEPIDQQGLLKVRVTVQADQPQQLQPVTFTLTRWIIDPETEYAIASEAAAAAATGSSSGSSTTGASGSGSGSGSGTGSATGTGS